MRRKHLTKNLLLAGVLCAAAGGCDGNTNNAGVTATGGTTKTGGGSGGAGTVASTGGGPSTPVVTGGVSITGGSSTTPVTGGAMATGGRATGGSATGGLAIPATGGRVETGGVVVAGGGTLTVTGGTATGGSMGTGGRANDGGVQPGIDAGVDTGSGTGTRTVTSTATGTGTGTGVCTASKAVNQTVTGTGPHKVVIETNGDAGIKCGTIIRPADLVAGAKYPILVWGEGACSQDGLSNKAAMGEVASWGYFVITDGTPGSTNACAGGQDGKAFLDYLTWAIAENGKSCSAYYQSLDTTKIAADGFSCGGLMSENVSGDPRFSAVGITSSGLMASNKALYDKIHTPFKILTGGSGDMAYANGLNDYTEISSRKIPIVYFSQSSAGHGGDLGNAKGTFNTVNLAWWNWQLKGDEGATGKGLLMGASCKYCTASGWVFKSANIP